MVVTIALEVRLQYLRTMSEAGNETAEPGGDSGLLWALSLNIGL